MSYKFSIKIPIWVHILILLLCFLSLFMLLTAEELDDILTSTIFFVILIPVEFILIYLQMSKKGGIEVDERTLIVYNIPRRIIPLEQIDHIEIGYNGNKNSMRIRYFEKEKLKSLHFGQSYSESLTEIAEKIKSLIEKRENKDLYTESIQKQLIIETFNKKKLLLVNIFFTGTYLVFFVPLSFASFMERKPFLYILFGVLLIVEILLSFMTYRKSIKLLKRMYISFVLFLIAVIFFVIEIVLNM